MGMVEACILGLSQLKDLSRDRGVQSMLWLAASVAVGQCLWPPEASGAEGPALLPVLCQQPPYLPYAQPDYLLGLGGCHLPPVNLGQHHCSLVLLLAQCHRLQVHAAMVTFSLNSLMVRI